jgi:hypothetical protein
MIISFFFAVILASALALVHFYPRLGFVVSLIIAAAVISAICLAVGVFIGPIAGRHPHY